MVVAVNDLSKNDVILKTSPRCQEPNHIFQEENNRHCPERKNGPAIFGDEFE